MKVSDYQIHNILKEYSERLRRHNDFDRQEMGRGLENQDGTRILSLKKQQAVINQVISDLIHHATPIKTKPETDIQQGERIMEDIAGYELQSDFVYNEVDRRGKKTTHTVSVDLIDFVLKRVNQAAQEGPKASAPSFYGSLPLNKE